MANGRGAGKTGRTDKSKRAERARDGEITHPDTWEPGLRFALKALSTKSVSRAQCPAEVLPVALCHNLRRYNEDHRHKSPIDRSRTHLNEVLVGPADPREAAKCADDTLARLGVKAKRIDQIMGIELVMQPPDGWDVPAFYRVCLQWVEERYEHVVSAVVHRDQRRPHLHVLVLAVAGNKLAGAELTSGVNRWAEQLWLFMAWMRSTLGLRPDRPNAAPARSTAHTTAQEGTTVVAQSERATVGNLIANEPHGPVVSQPNLMPTTSYWAVPQRIAALFDRGAALGHFPAASGRTPSLAPRPAQGSHTGSVGTARLATTTVPAWVAPRVLERWQPPARVDATPGRGRAMRATLDRSLRPAHLALRFQTRPGP